MAGVNLAGELGAHLERATAAPASVNPIERGFEGLLWSSRFVVLTAVAGSLAVGFAMFAVATVDVVHLMRDVVVYAIPEAKRPSEYPGRSARIGGTTPEPLANEEIASARAEEESAEHEKLRSVTVAHIVEVIDGYLLATIMLIFAFGLYELFISRIDTADREIASRLLLIHSLDDLKDRLAKVVLLILVVKFFERALVMEIGRPLDLVLFGTGIALVSAAIYLSHRGGNHAAREPETGLEGDKNGQC